MALTYDEFFCLREEWETTQELFATPFNFCGLVRVFEWDAETMEYAPKGSDLVGDGDEEFGYTCSLSSDGTVLAVGSLFGQRVRVFDYDDTEQDWVERTALEGNDGRNKAGEVAILSGDGSIVATGANPVLFWKYSSDAQKWEEYGSAVPYAGKNNQVAALSEDGTSFAIGSRDFKGSAGKRSGRIQVFDHAKVAYIVTKCADMVYEQCGECRCALQCWIVPAALATTMLFFCAGSGRIA